jgi:hypothetical protein
LKLGLTEEEFLDLTTAELKVFYDVQAKLEQREDFRFAQICYILAETNRDKKRKPYKIEDFMPRAAKVRKTKEELICTIKKFGAQLRQYG